MPRYFFHLATDIGYSIDEEGLDFEDLDAAYLDACRAVLDMSVHMLRMQQDPNRHRFDIVDDAGVILMDLPFSEVMRARSAKNVAPNADDTHTTLKARIARSKALRMELVGQISAACETLEKTQRLLSKS